MSFWNDLAQGFNGQPVMPRPVPETIRRQIRRVHTWLEALAVTKFLVDNFGNPPRTPTLRIPPSELFGPEHLVNTFAFYLPTAQISENISPPIDKKQPEILVGCVRYKLWARSQPVPSDTALAEIPENCQHIFTVDCFCVDRRFRSKGRKIGTWLLKYLHYFANTNAIPYAVFMKEGAPLTIPIWPFRSGIYAWAHTVATAGNFQRSMPLSKITEKRVFAWLQNYYNIQNSLEFTTSTLSNKIIKSNNNPKLFPMTHNNQNAFWYLYRDSISLWILIRTENTNQEHTKGGRIGYFTDIFVSQMFNSDKMGLSGLLYEIAKEVSRIQGYSWIWLDSGFVITDAEGAAGAWKVDGPNYVYGFQW